MENSEKTDEKLNHLSTRFELHILFCNLSSPSFTWLREIAKYMASIREIIQSFSFSLDFHEKLAKSKTINSL